MLVELPTHCLKGTLLHSSTNKTSGKRVRKYQSIQICYSPDMILTILHTIHFFSFLSWTAFDCIQLLYLLWNFFIMGIIMSTHYLKQIVHQSLMSLTIETCQTSQLVNCGHLVATNAFVCKTYKQTIKCKFWNILIDLCPILVSLLDSLVYYWHYSLSFS